MDHVEENVRDIKRILSENNPAVIVAQAAATDKSLSAAWDAIDSLRKLIISSLSAVTVAALASCFTVLFSTGKLP